MNDINELGLPVGFALADWTPCALPPSAVMDGQYCRLEPLTTAHAPDLHAANLTDVERRIWTYLGYGPFEDLESYSEWVDAMAGSMDPMFFAVIDLGTGSASGVASYLRLEPAVGSIEVGHINFAPPLQGTQAATEAMYLMMKHAFADLGYRRYEWKCDSLNAKSRAAAERLGFVFEGIFRQCTIYKNRNRDTAWYSIIDEDWPPLRRAFENWLASDNFDEKGRQKTALSEMTAKVRGRSPIVP